MTDLIYLVQRTIENLIYTYSQSPTNSGFTIDSVSTVLPADPIITKGNTYIGSDFPKQKVDKQYYIIFGVTGFDDIDKGFRQYSDRQVAFLNIEIMDYGTDQGQVAYTKVVKLASYLNDLQFCDPFRQTNELLKLDSWGHDINIKEVKQSPTGTPFQINEVNKMNLTFRLMFQTKA